MKFFASLIIAAATLTAAPAMAHEGKCMWDSLTPAHSAEQQQLLSAPTEAVFSDVLPNVLTNSGQTMFAACNIPKEGQPGAMWAFAGYAASIWIAPRLQDRWDAQTLRGAFDSIPEDDVRVLTGRLVGAPLDPEETKKADTAIAVLYKPFGRTGQLTPMDDLDKYFAARALEYGGETSMRKAIVKP